VLEGDRDRLVLRRGPQPVEEFDRIARCGAIGMAGGGSRRAPLPARRRRNARPRPSRPGSVSTRCWPTAALSLRLSWRRYPGSRARSIIASDRGVLAWPPAAQANRPSRYGSDWHDRRGLQPGSKRSSRSHRDARLLWRTTQSRGLWETAVGWGDDYVRNQDAARAEADRDPGAAQLRQALSPPISPRDEEELRTRSENAARELRALDRNGGRRRSRSIQRCGPERSVMDNATLTPDETLWTIARPACTGVQVGAAVAVG